MNDKWIDWIIELQSLAQAGLEYGKSVYDLERYARIRELAAMMLSEISSVPIERVKELFCNETGYQTPKIDTRAVIIKNNKILLVKERNGKWSLPGGWCDVNLSIAENTVKEAREESGLDVIAEKIIAVQDRNKHNLPKYAYGICKIFVECRALSGDFVENSETTEREFFAIDELPILDEAKNTAEQIAVCFEAYRQGDCWKTIFD